MIRAYDAMTKSVNDASAAKGLDHDKNLKALEDTNAYQGSLLQMAQADATLAESKAKLAGATDVAAVKETAFRLSLVATLQKMSPDDPERKWLQQYIDELYAIPSNIDTTITLKKPDSLPGQRPIGGYASGTSSAPGGLAWVGEQGPELVNLPGGSQVYPNGTGPGGYAPVFNISVTAGWGANGQDIGQKIISEIKKFESGNGSGWRR